MCSSIITFFKGILIVLKVNLLLQAKKQNLYHEVCKIDLFCNYYKLENRNFSQGNHY